MPFGLMFVATAALMSPTHEAIAYRPLAAPALGWRRPRSRLARVAALVGRWRRRAAERQDLRRLDDRLLRDIGLTRQDVLDEQEKPFWRA
jgi:uncharacterized protein YjiS (DUF1127 family)